MPASLKLWQNTSPRQAAVDPSAFCAELGKTNL
jgi:hypothetical protein